MSRIHEALKLAEQQRANSNETAGAGPDGGVTPGAIPIAIPSSQIPSDFLVSHCRQANWSPDAKTMLFFNSDEQTYGTEQFRTLRSRLYQMREKQHLKKVLVTSSLPKEGKTFVAANLAQVIVRQQGRRALLIDADLRAARLHLALGAEATPGLSEYLLGEADETAIMQRGAMENLIFIPSGRSVSNPAELVANGRLKSLLERVEGLFDWIVIDSPPAVPISDAGLLASYCDGILMVVRSGSTPYDVARKARDEFNGKRLVGVVLNGTGASSLDAPYYYKVYGRP